MKVIAIWLTGTRHTDFNVQLCFKCFKMFVNIPYIIQELSEDNIVCWRQPNFNSNCQLVQSKSQVKDDNANAQGMKIVFRTFMFRQTKKREKNCNLHLSIMLITCNTLYNINALKITKLLPKTEKKLCNLWVKEQKLNPVYKRQRWRVVKN